MQLINPYSSARPTLRNRECGRRIFVLANGPSINEEDLRLLKDEVVIGMNASTMLEERFGFESRYYVLSDARFIAAPHKRPWATERLAPTTHRIVRADLRPLDEQALAERTLYVRALARDGFSRNLANGFFYGCTTTMLALQLAWFLGSREVYLLGCDLRYPQERPRFYAEPTPQLEDSFTSVQMSNILNAAMEFEKAGGKLISCSRQSFLRPYLHFQQFSDVISRQEGATSV
jgi:hypothetical protein